MNGVIADGLAKLVDGKTEDWPSKLPEALCAMRTSVSMATGFAPASLVLGSDIATPLYVEMHGAPPIHEKELGTEAEGKRENMGNLEGADRGHKMLEKHYQEIAASKVTGQRIGSAPPRKRVERPLRGASHEQIFEESAKRHKGFFYEAEKAKKKKTTSNVANYNRRNNVGNNTIEAGDMVPERDMQYGTKMGGRI